MTSKLRIQEEVKNGRIHLFAKGYDTIPEALKALYGKVRERKREYNRYNPVTDEVTNTATITTDRNTFYIIEAGRSRRTFAIVTKADRTPIPFGHLVKQRT